MQTITRLRELATDELLRIRETLIQRYGVGRRGNIVEIAFGMATRQGSPDRARMDSVCFYVRHKRTPREKRDRIPPVIEVRLRRKQKFVLVRLPSDIVDIGPHTIRVSGRRTRHLSRRSEYAMTGCVVAWRVDDQSSLTWGVVTVGHLFHHIRRLPQVRQRVRIQFGTSPAQELTGTLLARSKKRDGSRVDASLVQVVRESLVQAALIPRDVSTLGKVVRAVSDLRNDQGELGTSLPARQRVPFVVQRFLPLCRLVPQLGLVTNVVDVASDRGNAFGKGRSGSLWVVARQAAGIQFAGLPGDYLQGWGQSLETILAWVRQQVARLNEVGESRVDLRLIRAI